MDALPEPIPRYCVEPVQYAGLLLINWNSHVHGIVPEGVFTESGHFVHIPDFFMHRAEEFWQERVFSLLLDEHKINEEIAASMRGWKHSGFSVDASVRIEAGDKAGMQRLIQYVSRCPFSLARMVSVTDDGKILYRASHANCLPFPISGDKALMKGIPRNFEVFEPLDFLAEVVQHIPNKGEHQIRYFGFYSNKKRGMQLKKMPKAQQATGMDEPDTPYRRKSRIAPAPAEVVRGGFDQGGLRSRPSEVSQLRGHNADSVIHRETPVGCGREDPSALRSLEGGCATSAAQSSRGQVRETSAGLRILRSCLHMT